MEFITHVDIKYMTNSIKDEREVNSITPLSRSYIVNEVDNIHSRWPVTT